MPDEQLTTQQSADTGDARTRVVPVLRGVLPGDRTFVELLGERWLVGRGEECDIRPERSKISRKHAELRRQGPILTIRDLGSTNGTYLNGTRVQHAACESGSIVRIGEWLGVFEELTPAEKDVRFGQLAPGIWGGVRLARAVEVLARAAPSGLPILLIGRTGTGKERFARAVHELSGQAGPFHAINCAALPPALAEAELFGYQRGAFTGADRPFRGHLRQADGGTLFLDEVSDLPLSVQAKLLRALDSGETAPLGDSSEVRFEARVVAACHEPVKELVSGGRMRPDFAARLAGLTVELPDLQERRADVPALFERFLQVYSASTAPEVSIRLYERLCLYDWPGNVRELELLARRVLALHGHEPRLRRSHVPEIEDSPPSNEGRAAEPEPPHDDSIPPDERNAADVAKLADALRLAKGNVTAAAQAAGISRQRAYRLIGSRRLGGYVAASREPMPEQDDGRDD